MANKFDCYYGASGEGKTTAIIRMVTEVYNLTGKLSRIYVGDGSRANYEDSGLVDAGVVKLYDYSIFDYPMTVIQQIAEGWVPEDPDNPKSKFRRLTPDEVAETGLWGFEGLSVMASLIMGDKPGALAYRAAQGEKIGQDSPISIVDPSGRKFGGNPMSHYNVAQRHIGGVLQRTKSLPGIKIWTAHERSTEDKLEGVVIGPEVAGKAMTATISREFNNTLHFCTATKPGKVQDKATGKTLAAHDREYRVYTRDHADPDGLVLMRYKAVTRCLDPNFPPYFTGEGPGDNIVAFYHQLAMTNKAWTERMLKTPAPKAVAV